MPVPKLRFKDKQGRDYHEWESFKLISISDVHTGQKPSKIYKTKSNCYQYINAGTSDSGYTDEFNCSENTITTPSRGQGGIGYIGFQRRKFWLGPLCYAIKSTNKNVNIEYLYYFLLQNNNLILDLKKVGSIPAINKNDLLNINVKVPSLPEQEKIADFLSSYDRMIDVQSQRVEAMKARKKGLLQKIFSQEIRFKDDHGQEYPEWKCSKLSECTKLIKDGTHGTHKNVDEGYPLLSAKDILGNKITIPKDCRKIDKQDYEAIYKNYRLRNDDLLLTIVGTIGRVGYYSSEYGEIAFQRSVAIIRMNDLILPRFMLFELMASKFQIELAKRQSQSAQAGIYLGELSSIPIYYPSLPEQQKIADFLTAVDAQIEVEEKRLETMKTIKKGLLQQMFI